MSRLEQHDGPRAKGALRRAVHAAHVAALLVLGCAGSNGAAEVSLLPSRAGYPETTSLLTIDLGGGWVKSCHAGLVHPRWALTAAHCFSSVEPSARGALREFVRGFSSDDVEFHPAAHRSGATRRDAIWLSDDFVAAHDLALVPIEPPLADVTPIALAAPSDDCELRLGSNLAGEFGQLGFDDAARTASAEILGLEAAAALLGAGHEGWLLSAQGASVGPGDSGSAMSSDREELSATAPGCVALGESPRVLLGVVQDAHPDGALAPFGLVPMYSEEHVEWLKQVFDATPERPSGAPRLDSGAPLPSALGAGHR